MAKKEKRLSVIAVRRRPGHPAEGLMRYGNVTVRCALGRSGVTAFKREGDGATPLAAMRLCYGYLKTRRNSPAGSRLALRAIRADDGWCDAVLDRNYNRPVRLPYPASAERLLRDDCLYDVCVVLDWNLRCRRQACGSAIFLHIAKPGYPPTQGCIAVSAQDMARLLPLISSKTVVRVVG